MTSKSHTIASLLNEARTILKHKSDSPRLDAEALLGHCIGKNRTYLFTWPEAAVDHVAASQFYELLEQRQSEVPLAYLTGSKEFWSLDFTVTTDTLIPRPDTELLVQLAVESLNDTPGPVLDLGTGSGVIAICIAHEHPEIRVDAVDNSEAALVIARQNSTKHNACVNFLQSDWYSNVERKDYQLIVSNPPYIDKQDDHLHRGGLQFEPDSALSAAENGLAAIKHIVTHASEHCRTGGWVMIEHGFEQGLAARQLMQDNGLHHVRTEQDIENRDRVTLGQIGVSQIGE